MERIHPDGFFEAVFPRAASSRSPTGWRSRTTRAIPGSSSTPTSFGPVLTDFDLHLLGEGTHYQNYERLGAHLRTHEGFRGVHFAVWAPNAHAGQRGRQLQPLGRPPPPDAELRLDAGSGRSSSPTCGEGEVYKFEIKSRYHGYLVEKADPYGFAAELRPRPPRSSGTSRKFTLGTTTSGWPNRDEAPGARRARSSVYEVHLGSWKRKVEEGNRFLTYRELADELVEYLEGDGLHPRRAAADQRAPVRRQLGLSARRLLRADVAVRHARRLRLLRRHAAPARLSA